MNLIMIPFLMFTSITQIKVSEYQTLQAHIIDNETKIDRKYLALSPENFILVKSIVESNDNDCKDLITDSVEACNVQLEACWSSCNSIPNDQKRLISVLKRDKSFYEDQTKKLEKINKILTYIAIGTSSIALASGAYIILK